MSSDKPTPEAMEQAALAIARAEISGLAEAYAAAVKQHAVYYDRLPDADDFYGWLEGHDWQHERTTHEQ